MPSWQPHHGPSDLPLRKVRLVPVQYGPMLHKFSCSVPQEISSWWDLQLTVMIFFCCMVASLTSTWLNSCFEGWAFNYAQPWVLENTVHFQEVVPLSLCQSIECGVRLL